MLHAAFQTMAGNFALDLTRSRRVLLLAGSYVAILAVSHYLAYEVRFDFLVPKTAQRERIQFFLLAVGMKLIALVAMRQLGTRLSYFGIPDLVRIVFAICAANFGMLVIWLFSHGMMAPGRSVILIDCILSVVGVCVVRISFRIYRERLAFTRATRTKGVRRVAILGAGDAGAAFANEALNRPTLGLRPVFFLDDNPQKHGVRIHGLPVLGAPEEIAAIREKYPVDVCVLAMPSAPGRRMQELFRLLSEKSLTVEIVPSLQELASGRVRVTKIRPVDVVDLLGRESVDLNDAEITRMVRDRIVLVTGAGGSIGSELCRQIAALNPRRLLLVEQSEGALFLIEQELNELGFSGVIEPLVADILDRARMEFIFARYRPEVIFHAAAHKHVFMMERQAAVAIRNNAIGTARLAAMASDHGALAFVLISTDKAINPTNVMGATKRLAELQLMALAGAGGSESGKMGKLEFAKGVASASPFSGATGPTKFLAVRFGNVLGSSGSVIPIFKRQIANGGPVTVTHPDVTRYFMTIPEAVGLVLQTYVLGQGGEIFVLDMGQPVKIVDLAKQMIELSGFRVGDDIEIKFTGLKPGEKLFEELQHHTEEYAPTAHPRIMRFRSLAKVDPAEVERLEPRLHAMDSNQLKQELKRFVPEYTPFMD